MQLNQPFAWLLLLSAMVPLHLIIVMWRRHEVPGAKAVLLFLSAMAVWSLGYAFELFNTRLDAILFWAKIQYIGITIVPVAWLLFSFQYTQRRHWLAPANVILLFIEPLAILFLAFTNELHGFVYQQVSVGIVNNFAMLQVIRGPAFWIHVAYSYLLLLSGTVVVLVHLLRERETPREQAGWVLLGVLAPWIGNLVYILRLTPIDPTPLGFTITGFALSVSISRFQMFSIIPIARGQLLDRMVDAVLVVNEQDEIIDANPAAQGLFSHVRGELTGKALAVAFAPWLESLAAFLVRGVVQSEDAGNLETASIGAASITTGRDGPGNDGVGDLAGSSHDWDGEVNLGNSLIPHWFHLRVTSLYHQVNPGLLSAWRPDDGRVLAKHRFGRLMVFQDIQERKQNEEAMIEARDQALQASMFKGQLIANVSHDLRTPLNAIMGYTEMLLEGTYGPVPAEQAEIMQQVLLSAQQMGLFVGDLLDQALIEKGRLALYPVDFRPEDLLHGVQSLIGQAAEKKGLQLRTSADPDLPPVLRGDVKRLQQIVMNLIHNAIKFTNEGWVSVRLYCVSPNTWGIEVADTGVGISQEARAFIFEPFRQVEKTAEPLGGAGLGLAIVRHLVQMMGGYIELESHLGLGSVFRVILPLGNG